MGVVFLITLLLGCTYLVVTEGSAEPAPSLIGVLTGTDKERLVNLFQDTNLDSLQTAFYVTKGLAILGSTNNVQKKACDLVKKKAPPPSDLVATFYATSIGATLKCQATMKAYANDLKNALKADRNISEYYYIVSSLVNIGQQVDESLLKIAKVIETAETEESIMSYGMAFLTGALVKDGDLTSLLDLIEDVVAQADESPTALYFEGGLLPTATVLTGSFVLASKADKRPTISALQASLFANYITSLRYTGSISEAYYMLTAAEVFSTNQFIKPVGVFPIGKKSVSHENKNIQVTVLDTLGNNVEVKSITVVSVSGANEEDEVTSINKPFTVAKDIYSYPLYSDLPQPGRYMVNIKMEPKKDTPVPSLVNVQFPVTSGLLITIATAELTILEKDQNVAVKTAVLNYPGVSKEQFSADQHSMVKMTFKLTDKQTKNPVTAHQVFVQLIGSANEDIFFVAMPTTGKGDEYVFELDVAGTAKESFGSKSGAYKMSLIVGGDAILNPVTWEVGTLTLKFADVPSVEVSDEQKYCYKPKPVIEHLFAVPEKRPPQVISLAFSVMVMAPLIILVVVWLFLGANISKITLSGPWALLFHFGIAGVFMLYYCFWTQLNMFQTLKYLALLGGVTFFAGNRMLKNIAKQ